MPVERVHSDLKMRIANAPTTQNSEFRATSMTLKSLRSYWNRCCNGGSEDWFHRLWEMHTEHTRHYHTAVHLLEMCELLDIVTAHGESSDNYDTKAILLAIFFHDAVYNARSTTNEEDSAELFQTFAKSALVLGEQTAKDVYDWILATKHHQTSIANASDTSLQLFLDLDMAVLGKISTAYQEYAYLIRQEYKHVPADLYCERRASILESFLQQPSIYCSPPIREALEQRARENLQNEISLLRQGLILPSQSPINRSSR